MNRPEPKDCRCQKMVRCQCEGWNQACEEWEEYHDWAYKVLQEGLKKASEDTRKHIEDKLKDMPPEMAKLVDKHFWELI